jgi:tetratricopeptide (TPR) repeat protein|tara:strand:- start:45 stop:443 length:399 start_codon:yes stop_codon:yes gene_type:complete
MNWLYKNLVRLLRQKKQLSSGLAAAQMIVKVADENNASAEIRHNNYWMLGAHLLAAGDAGKAKKAWRRALKIYSHDEGLAMLCWIALADSVTNNDSENLDHQLELLVKEGGNLASTANRISVAGDIFLSNKF